LHKKIISFSGAHNDMNLLFHGGGEIKVSPNGDHKFSNISLLLLLSEYNVANENSSLVWKYDFFSLII